MCSAGGHVVIRLQPQAAASSWFGGGLVRHVRDLAARPQVFFGRPVAVEAPLHLERLRLIHEGHLVDRAVAGRAADALLHMDLVVEVDEIW